jgi:hypothetical protein
METTKAVLNVLRQAKGINRRVSRSDLMELVSMQCSRKVSDREVRQAVEDARLTPEGSLICSSTSKGGYWFATDKEELEQYLRQDERRCLTMCNRIRKQREAAGLALSGGHDQATLFDMPDISKHSHYDYN